MAEASDQDIWQHAAAQGFTIVSLDSDFAGHGFTTRATAKSVVAAMREPINRKNRTVTARAPSSYRIL